MRGLSKMQEEDGAVAVLVAVLLVVLLGFAAIVIDFGRMYGEKAQLQNGADAAALSLAQECANDDSAEPCSPTSSLMQSYADANALDGASGVDVKLPGFGLPSDSRTAVVTTSAKEAGIPEGSISTYLAGVLGIESLFVQAQASAEWGSPTAGTTPFPLAFSICQVRGKVDGTLQRLQSHGSGANPSCNYGPSGGPVPGGFGWLSQDATSCGATIDITVEEGSSNTGNDEPDRCAETLRSWAADLNAGDEVIVLLPVFNKVTGTGSSATYKLTSFAAFSVVGWKFSGNDTLPSTFRNTTAYVGADLACTGNCRGIIGSFIEYVSLKDGYKLGPVDENGATVVRLTK